MNIRKEVSKLSIRYGNNIIFDFKEIIEHINKLSITIEKLKCCGNCKHSVSMSEIGINYVRPCFNCVNNNKWELEEIK